MVEMAPPVYMSWGVAVDRVMRKPRMRRVERREDNILMMECLSDHLRGRYLSVL